MKGSYNEELKDWRGYLPMAIDGSHIALPPEAASRESANLNKKMKELFKFEGESAPEERLVWRGEDMS